MKFSHQLRLNSVPDWADAYIAYSNLKKHIYALERLEAESKYGAIVPEPGQSHILPAPSTTEDAEGAPLLTASSSSGVASPDAFVRALDAELDKIVTFYVKKEKELFDATELLRSDVNLAETLYTTTLASRSEEPSRNQSPSRPETPLPVTAMEDSLVSLPDQHQPPQSQAPVSPPRSGPGLQHPVLFNLTSPANTPPTSPMRRSNLLFHDMTSSVNMQIKQNSVWSRKPMQDQRIRLGRIAIDLYVALCDLRDYATLNLTGFSKILKKFDKITGSSLRKSYLAKVSECYPFKPDAQTRVVDKVDAVERIYARLITYDDLELAAAELKTNLRQHVAFDRNTIWRDMIQRERRVHAVEVAKEEDRPQYYEVSLLGREYKLPRLPTSAISLAVGIGLLLVLLNYDFFNGDEQKQACLAILICASWLWATEALPLFVTSLCIPFLVILLRVCNDPNSNPKRRMDTHEATKYVFGAMFSPVIMLLLGGFAIAAALSRHFIAKILAVSLLSRAGTKTIWVLLATMFVATFASMWISNVAAPVLCFSIVEPILRTLPENSTFGKALILGIALASNIGGMASPISSPQNVIAIANMKPAPSWAHWFIISLPICVVSNFIVWLLLLAVYSPHVLTPEIMPLRRSQDKLSKKQWFIIGTTIFTIFLWCIESTIEPWIGDMGVIAILPLVVFFGTGILAKEDFNNFLWTVIVLAMGGIALGRAVENSGLLEVIAESIKHQVQHMSTWGILFVFSGLVLVVATFISHTVAALIVLPVVNAVGMATGDDPHPRLLVMGAALMCSGAMGLPISGFPNMNAISQEDATGKPYLTTMDFVRVGVPGSVAVWLAVLTIGYGLSWLCGF